MGFTFDFSAANLPKQLFINNEYVNSKGSKKLEVYNPRDGSLVANDVPIAGSEDVDIAIAAAEAAFPAWRKISNAERQDRKSVV